MHDKLLAQGCLMPFPQQGVQLLRGHFLSFLNTQSSWVYAGPDTRWIAGRQAGLAGGQALHMRW